MSQNNEHPMDNTDQTNTNNDDAPYTSMYPRLSPDEAFDGIIATLQATREEFCKPTNNISVKLQNIVRDFRACIKDGYRTLEALEDKAGRKAGKSEATIREQEDVSAKLVNARLITNQAISKMGMAHVVLNKAIVEETALLEKLARLKK
jgi:hypothetical protein